jgi:hypothetical protein
MLKLQCNVVDNNRVYKISSVIVDNELYFNFTKGNLGGRQKRY